MGYIYIYIERERETLLNYGSSRKLRTFLYRREHLRTSSTVEVSCDIF